MDNNMIPNASSQTPSQVHRVSSVPPAGGQAVQEGKNRSTSQIPESTRTFIDQQLFALEQYVPVQILQNPQLLKAEWAWKIFIMQHLALQGMFQSQTNSSKTPSIAHDTQSSSIAQNTERQASVVSSESRDGSAPVVQPPTQPSPLQEGAEPFAQAVVQRLWNALSTISRQSESSPNHVYVNRRTESPILPFASMNQEIVQFGQAPTDKHRLSAWMLEDRIVSSALDNPYEQIGGGLFFPPLPVESAPPHEAVKWTAHRQTRMGAGGKLIHRIRFEVDVKGHSLTCILTAQRPQLLIHFVSPHVKLRKFLEQGADFVNEPLRQCGWDLVSWTTGEPSHV